MSTRSGRIRTSAIELSPPRTRKRVSPYRSPARTRKSSPPPKKTPPPARSSGRKSPARKSPSRKPPSKFPARKSPSRATKEIEPAVTKLPPKRSINTEVAIMLEDLSSKLEIYRGTRSRRFEYSVKDVSSTITGTEFSADKINGLENDYGMRNRKPIEKVVSHRSSRLREFDDIPDVRSSVSKSLSHSNSMSKSVSKSIDTYSDEENSEEELHKEKSRSVTRKLATPLRCSINGLTQISNRLEFGGQIGSTIFIILIPLIVFCILVSCKKSSSFKFYSDIVDHKSLKTWFSLPALGIFSSQLFIQAVFALLPVFGTRYDRMDDTGIKYCFNAFFSSIFTVSVLFVLDFLQIFNKNYLLNEHLRLAVLSYIFAFILSIVLYVKSHNIDDKKLNQYGDTGYTLYDLFMGREIHPFIKNLDVKIWISRISNISTLILLSLIFMQGLEIYIDENKTLSLDNYKEFLNKVQLKPTILLFTTMQIVYVLNFIVREHKITTTFFWQSEGVGYLQTVSTALYPYYFTTISKHVADTKLVLSTNILISSSILYLLGFFIMLYSNNVKYEFRRNPLHLSLAHIDSIPTFHGKRLLVSGPWGILRHPNYTGDILIHIALALPGIVSRQYVAAMPALLTIVVLIHRAWRDHGRCKRKYGAAWQRYCKRVPSVFIPKVL